jgi:hypothetical protein
MSRYQTKKGALFEAECRKFMKLRHISSLEELRSLTSVGSNTTFLKYMDDPECMPVGKMAEVLTALKMPKDTRLDIISKLTEGEK